MAQEAAKALTGSEGRAESEVKDDVVYTRWFGRIDGTVMRQAVNDMDRLLQTRQPFYWFSDTSMVGTYSVDIRKPATELLSLLKSRGLGEIVGVVPSPAVRMLSTSLTFVVGLRIKMFATAQQAMDYLSTAPRS